MHIFSRCFAGCIQWLSNIAMFAQSASRVRHSNDPKWHVSTNFFIRYSSCFVLYSGSVSSLYLYVIGDACENASSFFVLMQLLMFKV